MKGGRRKSLFDRIVVGKLLNPYREGDYDDAIKDAMRAAGIGAPGQPGGPDMEQAYRDLLLEYQVLLQSNERLHEKMAERDCDSEDSPATQELLRNQRNALVDRGRQLRELQYENDRLQRQHKRLTEENRRLNTRLQQRDREMQPALDREAQSRRELEEVRVELRRTNSELQRMTDKYFQLKARQKPTSAANGDF